MLGSLLTVLGGIWLGTGGTDKIKQACTKPKSAEWHILNSYKDHLDSPEVQEMLEDARYFDKYGKARPKNYLLSDSVKEYYGRKIIYRSPKRKGIVTADYINGNEVLRYYTYGYSDDYKKYIGRFSGGEDCYDYAVNLANECDNE